VFEVMLYPPAGESKAEKLPLEVKVPAVTVDVFSQLLKCIYSDKASSFFARVRLGQGSSAQSILWRTGRD
jgi:hypothetical protein